MKCPVCPATDLLMTAREGIEIDYCQKCRGVWLDRGELDRLVQRDEQLSLQKTQQPHQYARDGDWDRRDHDHRYSNSKGRHGYPRRKKSFLGEMFDFD